MTTATAHLDLPLIRWNSKRGARGTGAQPQGCFFANQAEVASQIIVDGGAPYLTRMPPTPKKGQVWRPVPGPKKSARREISQQARR